MRRRGPRVSIALTAVLAVWFGVLAGLPHTHRDRNDALPEQVCSAPAANQPTFHFHAVCHSTRHTCLACLVAGASAAPVAHAFALPPATAVGTAAVMADVIYARTRAYLPDQRGPPTRV